MMTRDDAIHMVKEYARSVVHERNDQTAMRFWHIVNLLSSQPAQHKSDWHPDFVTALYDNADPDKRYTMDQMREYADAFHRSRIDAANVAQGAEPIYQRNMSGAWIDTTLLGYENWPEDQRRIVYAAPPAQTALTDTQRLDWIDATNAPFKMGWRVSIAPAGNVSIGSVIQLGGARTSIREAIDAALTAAQSGDKS